MCICRILNKISMGLKGVATAIALTTFFTCTVFGQVSVTIPKQFIETVPPNLGSDQLYEERL